MCSNHLNVSSGCAKFAIESDRGDLRTAFSHRSKVKFR